MYSKVCSTRICCYLQVVYLYRMFLVRSYLKMAYYCSCSGNSKTGSCNSSNVYIYCRRTYLFIEINVIRRFEFSNTNTHTHRLSFVFSIKTHLQAYFGWFYSLCHHARKTFCVNVTKDFCLHIFMSYLAERFYLYYQKVRFEAQNSCEILIKCEISVHLYFPKNDSKNGYIWWTS